MVPNIRFEARLKCWIVESHAKFRIGIGPPVITGLASGSGLRQFPHLPAASGKASQSLPPGVAEIPAQGSEIEVVHGDRPRFEPGELVARRDRAEIEQRQGKEEGEHAGADCKVHIGSSHAVHPAGQGPRHPAADRSDEIGGTVSHCHRHRDDTPQPFRAEAVFGYTRAGRDRSEQRQRKDRQREDQRRPAQHAVAARFGIAIADHGIDQHEAGRGE